MRLILFVWLFTAIPASASTEVMTNFLPSIGIVGKNDLVFTSHNTLLFGGDSVMLGGYYSFESISESVMDQSYGGALRFGHETYFEIHGGYFQRDFRERTSRLRGRGYSGGLVIGRNLTPNFGLSLIVTGKRIAGGDLDRRTIVDLLPFLTLRAEF